MHHLVLDLDETLVHVVDQQITNFDFHFKLDGIALYGRIRPHCKLLIEYAFKNYASVSVWTAGTATYAYKVAKYIFTSDQLSKMAFFLTRRNVVQVKGQPCFKPLERLMSDPKAKKVGMTLCNTIIVDDKETTMRANPGNGIVIPAWRGDKRDTWLSKLIIILDGIKQNDMACGHYRQAINLKHLCS